MHVLFVISNIEKILKAEHKDILCTETQSEDENRPLARSNAAQEGGTARWEHRSISIRDPAETYFTHTHTGNTFQKYKSERRCSQQTRVTSNIPAEGSPLRKTHPRNEEYCKQ